MNKNNTVWVLIFFFGEYEDSFESYHYFSTEAKARSYAAKMLWEIRRERWNNKNDIGRFNWEAEEYKFLNIKEEKVL